jgi:excisionase family DNA binding protein
MYNLERKIMTLTNEITFSKDVLSFQEFLQYTGITKSFAYKLTSNNKIKFSKPNGKLIFFKKSDVDNWLLSKPNKTADELDAIATNYVFNNKRGAK